MFFISCTVMGPCLSPGIITRMDAVGEIQEVMWMESLGPSSQAMRQFTGRQLNAKVPRRWSSSEERPGHDDLEQRVPSQGHLFCKVRECCSKSRRQKSQRNRLHSALCLAELLNGVLYSEAVRLEENWAWNNRLVPNRKRSTSRLYIVTRLI